MFVKKNKILYSDWIYEWLIDKKEYIKENLELFYDLNLVYKHLLIQELYD